MCGFLTNCLIYFYLSFEKHILEKIFLKVNQWKHILNSLLMLTRVLQKYSLECLIISVSIIQCKSINQLFLFLPHLLHSISNIYLLLSDPIAAI